jgi:hypothetical protein
MKIIVIIYRIMYKSRANFLSFSKRKKIHFKKKTPISKKKFTMSHNKQTKKTAGRSQPSPRQPSYH